MLSEPFTLFHPDEAEVLVNKLNPCLMISFGFQQEAD